MKLLYNENDSPPMDFDSDEETLLRLPHDSCPPPPQQRGLCSHSVVNNAASTDYTSTLLVVFLLLKIVKTVVIEIMFSLTLTVIVTVPKMAVLTDLVVNQ